MDFLHEHTCYGEKANINRKKKKLSKVSFTWNLTEIEEQQKKLKGEKVYVEFNAEGYHNIAEFGIEIQDVDMTILQYWSGLPNPNFRNQEFCVKNQEKNQ